MKKKQIYYIQRSGDVLGPFRMSDLIRMQRELEIRPGDLISTSQRGPWTEIAVPSPASVAPQSTQTETRLPKEVVRIAESPQAGVPNRRDIPDVEIAGEEIPSVNNEDTHLLDARTADETDFSINTTTSMPQASEPEVAEIDLMSSISASTAIGNESEDIVTDEVGQQGRQRRKRPCRSCTIIFEASDSQDCCPVCRARASSTGTNESQCESGEAWPFGEDRLDHLAEIRLAPPPLPQKAKRHRIAKPQRSTARQMVWAISGAGLILALIIIWATGAIWSNPDLTSSAMPPENSTAQSATDGEPEHSISSPGITPATGLPQVVVDISRRAGLNQAERNRLQRDIERIEQSLQTSEILSKTVYQQQVARIEACCELTGLIAQSLGAQADDIQKVASRRDSREVLSDTVFQQLAVHISAHVESLALACRASGAKESEVAAIERALAVDDALSRTVQQQIAARLDTALDLTELLAKSLGAKERQLAELRATLSIQDSASETVFQQMSARQAGVAKMLGAAARAAGAPIKDIDEIERNMDLDDIRVDTVQQQLAARMKRSLEMLIVLAKAIVMK